MKTLKDFDYDLWAIEENGKKRYFARVKATGEETEIDLNVMRLLLSQEKQMRREYARQQIEGTILNLNAICDSCNMDEAAWMADTHHIDSDLLYTDIKTEFCKLLTDSQRSVFIECLIEGKSQTEFALDHRISIPMVNKQIRAIRKKAKKFFTEG
ncbi:MAG TPA: sigma-70 family RNA polymerase sigma factor [Clostridiaceae bacterium]|jgi:hypothetical protein|nr:sigma-70 family RNA polymerase sigma factor [Clostridiaceae bacterium]